MLWVFQGGGVNSPAFDPGSPERPLLKWKMRIRWSAANVASERAHSGLDRASIVAFFNADI